MTYFLEKNFIVDENSNLKPMKYGAALVRPCEWDYETCIDFITTGKTKKHKSMTLGGQVASFNVNWHQHNEKTFDSIEEWLIHLELEKNIRIDFEVTYICTNDYCHQYIAKTIDMHANKVIEDHMASAIEHVKKLNG